MKIFLIIIVMTVIYQISSVGGYYGYLYPTGDMTVFIDSGPFDSIDQCEAFLISHKRYQAGVSDFECARK